ncbi:MAG: tetratricopeptide repeat protein, partial [Pirellulaceae bacterium]
MQSYKFDENRKDHVWDDAKTVPLYFIKQYIEEVEEIEISNITIFLRKAIELDPQLVMAYYNRGAAYYNQGELDKAIVDLTKAI